MNIEAFFRPQKEEIVEPMVEDLPVRPPPPIPKLHRPNGVSPPKVSGSPGKKEDKGSSSEEYENLEDFVSDNEDEELSEFYM